MIIVCYQIQSHPIREINLIQIVKSMSSKYMLSLQSVLIALKNFSDKNQVLSNIDQ